MKTKRLFLNFVSVVALFAMMSQTLFAATWYVNSNGDDESATCVAGSTLERCTFREALVDYVAGDTIQFVTEGIDPVNRIITTDLLGAAYLIQRPVTVDGTGWSIDGNNTQAGSALVQIRHTVVDSVISLSGFSIYNSGGDGVSISVQEGGSAAGTTLDDLKVGVKVDGLTVDANADSGINVRAANTTIQNSVIAGNTGEGIEIGKTAGVNPSNFTISGNKIGVGTDGETVLANGTEDIGVGGGSNSVAMGESLIENNIISGNGGIYVVDLHTGNLTVQGNKVGVSESGLSTNTGEGSSPTSTLINIGSGDDISVIDNEVGNSDYIGIEITGVENVLVQGNEVSDSVDHAVKISDIAGEIVVQDNVVRGNGGSGVDITPSATATSITVQGNKIGTLDDGLTADGNGSTGLHIGGESSASVLIGGATAELGNVIAASGAESAGIAIDLLKAAVIQIMGNYIGVGIDGTTIEGLGNGYAGIEISGGTVTIGGDNDLKISLDDEIRSDELREGNVISNNGEGGRGIQIYPGEDNLGDVGIFGNIIGLIKDAVTGLYSVSVGQGIGITFEPDPEDGGDMENVTIGGTVAADGAVTDISQRNIIAGNTEAGIDLNDDIVLGDGKAVVIKNNYIGTDISGTLAVGNGVGIAINAPIEVTIGGEDEVAESDRNVISGNGFYGVGVYRGIANIFNNYIGVDATGENALGNGDTPLYGLFAAGVLGGTFFTSSPVLTLVSNVISGNYGAGVWIAGTDNADISENYIGTNPDGTSEIPNVASGEVFFSYLSSATAIDGSGIVVSDVSVPVDWDNMEGEWVAYTSNGTKIYDNVISGNEGSGVAIVHLDDTTELGWGPAGGGLDWTDGYIKNNVIGFAVDGRTALKNSKYGLYVEDVVGGANITNLQIGGSTNSFETSDNYGIYLKEIASSALSGGYAWLSAHNTFSNALKKWTAVVGNRVFPEVVTTGGGSLIKKPPVVVPPVEPPVVPPVEQPVVPPIVVPVVPPVAPVVTPVQPSTPVVEENDSEEEENDSDEDSEETLAQDSEEEKENEKISELFKDVDTRKVYEDTEYKKEVISLIVDNYTSGGNSKKYFSKVYDFSEDISEEEFGDAVVFGKKPGEIVTIPRIVNLRGKVGSSPAIKVLSKGNDDIFVEIASKDEGLYSPSYTLSGRTDAQGKAVLNYTLSDGEYVAGIYAQRGSEKVRGNESEFVVEGSMDREFFVQDLVVKEEYEHERITKSLGEFVEQVVETVEKIEPRFSANSFVEYRRTGDKVYFVEGKVRIPDDKNKVVYLAYQSITTGSVVIADASQDGKFSEMIPKILAKGKHSLMTYAYDPKEDKSTSLFRIVFERM